MRGRDRKTLRNYFQSGALPTAEHFGALIDSSVNRVDDGFDKTPADGLKIAWLSEPNFISFYRGDVFGGAVWRVTHDPDRDTLQIRTDAAAVSSLTVASERVGINNEAPATTLDVAGVIRAEGRAGATPKTGSALADGRWHPLTEWLTGCQALEVVAGVGGGRRSGRYALVHAIAMNAYNPAGWLPDLFRRRRPIRTLQASYGRSRDRILLRWATRPGHRREFRLEIRSRCRFPGDVFIQAHLTRLWFDPAMEGSGTSEASGGFGCSPETAGDTVAPNDEMRRRGVRRRD